MDLTTADLQHFTTCPRLYWLAQERSNAYMQWYDHFDACMHQLFNGLGLQVLSGEKPTLQNILKRWGALYYPNATRQSIGSRTTRGGRWQEPDRSLFFTGIVAIRGGHERWISLMESASSVGAEWRLPLGKNTLLGRHDLITEENGKQILWDLRFHPVPVKRSLRIDWELTAQAAAFRRVHKKLPDRIRVWEVILGEQGETTRSDTDFSALQETVTQVAGLIGRNVNYQAFSHQCDLCPYYQTCFSEYQTMLKTNPGR